MAVKNMGGKWKNGKFERSKGAEAVAATGEIKRKLLGASYTEASDLIDTLPEAQLRALDIELLAAMKTLPPGRERSDTMAALKAVKGKLEVLDTAGQRQRDADRRKAEIQKGIPAIRQRMSTIEDRLNSLATKAGQLSRQTTTLARRELQQVNAQREKLQAERNTLAQRLRG